MLFIVVEGGCMLKSVECQVLDGHIVKRNLNSGTEGVAYFASRFHTGADEAEAAFHRCPVERLSRIGEHTDKI